MRISPKMGLDDSIEEGDFPSFRSCRTHLSRQRLSPFHQVEHRQHGEGPIRIFLQTTIADLGKTPQTLERQEGMLDLGAHTGLAPVRCLVRLGQRRVPVSALVGEVLRPRGDLLESLPLRFASIGAVAVEAGFCPVQEVRS